MEAEQLVADKLKKRHEHRAWEAHVVEVTGAGPQDGPVRRPVVPAPPLKGRLGRGVVNTEASKRPSRKREAKPCLQ